MVVFSLSIDFDDEFSYQFNDEHIIRIKRIIKFCKKKKAENSHFITLYQKKIATQETVILSEKELIFITKNTEIPFSRVFVLHINSSLFELQ